MLAQLLRRRNGRARQGGPLRLQKALVRSQVAIESAHGGQLQADGFMFSISEFTECRFFEAA